MTPPDLPGDVLGEADQIIFEAQIFRLGEQADRLSAALDRYQGQRGAPTVTHSRITKAYWRIRWGATCVVCRMPSWINPPKYHEDWVGHEWKRWGHADWCPEPGGHDLDCLGHLATRHHQEIVLGPNVEYWKLHSVALSPEEIALRYKAQVMADNPVAYWHMGNKGGPDT